ncbi:MAG: adenylyl-sulfate kinase [Lentisphaerae bacterium GWF2_44_16]|nr:MAG: adenylyl-sulfate kinase [Lentisphaerae bacterium GWF2_44_16]
MRKDVYVIWFTGISGSGKTTVAMETAKEFKSRNIPFEYLDGDIVRNFFEGDLGYSRKERILNVRRIAFAAELLAEHGINVLVANIAPYYEVRDFIRRKIPNYIQIFLDASLEKVMERDVKGHYKKFKAGTMSSLIGVDDDYERPRNPDLTLHTDKETVVETTEKVIKFLKDKGIF